MTSTQTDRIEALIAQLPDPPIAHMRRSPEIEALLLAAVRRGFSSKGAAKVASLHPSTVTYWRRRDPEFNAAYRTAVADGRSATAMRIARKMLKEGDEVGDPWPDDSRLLFAASDEI